MSLWPPQPSDLLVVGDLQTSKKSTPLMVEFPVDPETSPMLVSGARDFIWVTPRRDRIRAATRLFQMPRLFMDIVSEVVRMSVESSWGSVHPLTDQGVMDAKAHLAYYDLTDVECIVADDVDIALDIPVHTASWLEPGYAVLIPRDRSFVGFALLVGNGLGLCVLHNPSRAIAVLQRQT